MCTCASRISRRASASTGPCSQRWGELTRDGEDAFSADELYVTAEKTPTTGLHIAFQAIDRETVERFHRAGLAAGAGDKGAPGERPYHPGYYSAYLLDPDGNNVEAVYHGPAKRSALRW
jgi:catechol 2,3-dioxygenase-like lactoylglutathione lyase family enzyme